MEEETVISYEDKQKLFIESFQKLSSSLDLSQAVLWSQLSFCLIQAVIQDGQQCPTLAISVIFQAGHNPATIWLTDISRLFIQLEQFFQFFRFFTHFPFLSIISNKKQDFKHQIFILLCPPNQLLNPNLSHPYFVLLSISIKSKIAQIMDKQQQLRKENQVLREKVVGYMDQISKVKAINEQHESEIETLLKFNQRLLTIIQTELNSYNSRKSQRSLSLQPISQITQKDSQALDPMNSIKLSINNLRFNEIQFKDDERRSRQSGNETDRVHLGENLQEGFSYEVSRSEYQKQLNSQTSKREKLKQVVALINQYKKQYGDSVQECDNVKEKIKQDAEKDNKQIKNFKIEKQQFYDSKIMELNNLGEKMKETNSKKQLEDILKQKRYSANTQNKLKRIMGK